MQDPTFRPPLPTPDGQIAPPLTPTYAPGDWQSAPTVVKGWVYPLTWLSIVFLPFVLIGLFRALSIMGNMVVPLIILNGAFLVTQIWLNRNVKKRTPAAWVVQIVFSGIVIASQAWGMGQNGANGIAGIIGILIHVYILSQWFKPEVKAWFGRS